MVLPFLQTLHIGLRNEGGGREEGGGIFLNSPHDFMFPKLLVAGHLLGRKIYEVREGEGDQGFLILRTESGQTFLLMLDKSATLNV